MTTTTRASAAPRAPGTTPVADDLRPLREAVLVEAAAEADAVVARAEETADQRVREARTRLEHLVADAWNEGRRLGEEDLARRRARARRGARRQVLAAQMAAILRLRRAALEQLQATRGTDEHTDLLARLTATAVDQLGPDTVVEHTQDGGVVATSGSRRVDYSLGALVDRAVSDLGEEVSRLWT